MTHSHDSTEVNTILADFTLPGYPQGIRDDSSVAECGRYGLKFETKQGDQFLKAVSEITLDRKSLGTDGKALYQSDFFIPADNGSIPYTMAVLAVLSSDNTAQRQFSFYRFGILKGERVFFSFTHNTPQPIIYEQSQISDLKLKRPGWHRFQIIFNGQEEIICAIDGRPTSFSPLKDATLDKLKAGVMASSSMDKPSGICFADNLSIQWTKENLALPDSPWIYSLESQQAQSGYVNPSSPFMPQAQLNWRSSPEDSWKEQVATNRPLLILFYTPKANGYKNLEQFINVHQEAQNFLRQFTLLRIEVNQLRGGTIAQQFQVFKVPCFLLLGADGKEKTKKFYTSEADWAPLTTEIMAKNASQ
ncbi:thioredoxin family protein [Candidatus Sumerlaeota bacterium]|nr:thioredoxin family protein [Candidatus Sumerlaeota bacterium]